MREPGAPTKQLNKESIGCDSDKRGIRLNALHRLARREDARL